MHRAGLEQGVAVDGLQLDVEYLVVAAQGERYLGAGGTQRPDPAEQVRQRFRWLAVHREHAVAGLDSGIADQIKLGVSYTRDPNDAAAIYTRDIHSFFIQDKWDISDSAELIFGLRFDEYRSDDLPILNDNFVLRYGITNQVGFDGLDAVQPRIGFNYTLPDSWGDTRLSLGFGVFSGNDPTVWFSNAYQNFGGALGLGDTGSFRSESSVPNTCTAADLQVLSSGSFQGIPECVVASGQAQAQATGRAGSLVAWI